MINSERGYTLIELLAVMIIMVTVGVIVAAILVSSLRGGSKANTIDTIRKNGNYTILEVSKMLEFAQSFVGMSTNGTTYTTDCLVPTTQYSSIRIVSFDNQTTTFACTSGNPRTIASNSASLLNTNEVALVQNSCYFTCSRNITVPPTIGINFILSQKLENAPFEKKETINFQTSVILRNLNK